jgi:hypothetical protein
MFVKQMLILRDITVIEIGNPQIEQHIEKERKIEDGEIETIGLFPNYILHTAVYTENPDRFHQ